MYKGIKGGPTPQEEADELDLSEIPEDPTGNYGPESGEAIVALEPRSESDEPNKKKASPLARAATKAGDLLLGKKNEKPVASDAPDAEVAASAAGSPSLISPRAAAAATAALTAASQAVSTAATKAGDLMFGGKPNVLEDFTPKRTVSADIDPASNQSSAPAASSPAAPSRQQRPVRKKKVVKRQVTLDNPGSASSSSSSSSPVPATSQAERLVATASASLAFSANQQPQYGSSDLDALSKRVDALGDPDEEEENVDARPANRGPLPAAEPAPSARTILPSRAAVSDTWSQTTSPASGVQVKLVAASSAPPARAPSRQQTSPAAKTTSDSRQFSSPSAFKGFTPSYKNGTMPGVYRTTFDALTVQSATHQVGAMSINSTGNDNRRKPPSADPCGDCWDWLFKPRKKRR